MWNPNLFMTRTQMREYDRIAIEEIGIPGPLLMENAGGGAAKQIMKRFPNTARVAVIAGPGNNGGDGFVIARHLINHGYAVTTYLAHPRSKVFGDALLNLNILESMDPLIEDISTNQALHKVAPNFGHRDIVVDALLGTGVSRDVEGHLGDIIDRINQCAAHVVAIDIPSGLDADKGTPWGRSVRAEMTITFGHLKRGLLLQPGIEYAGDVTVVSIGVPGQVSKRAGIDGAIISEEQVRAFVPKRSLDSHKGTFGHLLVVGGLLGKTGAAAMVGRAAMRVGTGLCTVATTARAQPIIESKCMEVMVDHLVDSSDAPLNDRTAKKVDLLLDGKRAVALGPGLGTSPGISALAIRLLKSLDVPAVVDADGINILAEDPTAVGRIETPMVFTPHPGEMARLVKKSVHAVQTDRIGISREAAVRNQVVLVLKGAHTVVAAPDGRVFINPTGNPGMASAGMGDVLTGIIGGFLAQGVPPLEAALTGVFLHGKAGDMAQRRIGSAGLLASDVIDDIPNLMKAWAETNE
jgi:ADP-dependent NAD(P)H-hydrate dehydratase / NAD(P)H-hydrate epimerase